MICFSKMLTRSVLLGSPLSSRRLAESILSTFSISVAYFRDVIDVAAVVRCTSMLPSPHLHRLSVEVTTGVGQQIDLQNLGCSYIAGLQNLTRTLDQFVLVQGPALQVPRTLCFCMKHACLVSATVRSPQNMTLSMYSVGRPKVPFPKVSKKRMRLPHVGLHTKQCLTTTSPGRLMESMLQSAALMLHI